MIRTMVLITCIAIVTQDRTKPKHSAYLNTVLRKTIYRHNIIAKLSLVCKHSLLLSLCVSAVSIVGIGFLDRYLYLNDTFTLTKV